MGGSSHCQKDQCQKKHSGSNSPQRNRFCVGDEATTTSLFHPSKRAAAPEGDGAGAKDVGRVKERKKDPAQSGNLRTGLEPVNLVDGVGAVHMARGHLLAAKEMVEPRGIEPLSEINFIGSFLHGYSVVSIMSEDNG